jgi:hypothetical protein
MNNLKNGPMSEMTAKAPEFVAIMNDLIDAVSENVRSIDSVINHVDNLKRMDLDPTMDDSPVREARDLSESLWFQISRIHESNHKLNKIDKHLHSLIG